MLRLSMICALVTLLAACGSQPAKLQDLGEVVQTPTAPAPIPPATQKPPTFSFQTELQNAFVSSPTVPTP